jgi:hypothetical protein
VRARRGMTVRCMLGIGARPRNLVTAGCHPAVGRGGRRLQRLNSASESPSSRCAMSARTACWTMRLRMTYSVPAPSGAAWAGPRPQAA